MTVEPRSRASRSRSPPRGLMTLEGQRTMRACSSFTTGRTDMATAKNNEPIPRRILGSTDTEVCIMGLGGYHLGTIASKREAVRIVQAAVEGGITFLDNAWEYHDGESERL